MRQDAFTQQSSRRVENSVNPDNNDFDDIIRHNFSNQRCQFLLSRGVDYDSFMRRESSFLLGDLLQKITTDIPRVVAKNVPVAKQLKTFNTLVNKPLAGNPLICLSSFPSDLRAKHLALYLMNRAVDAYTTSNIRKIRSKAAPLWHRVYTGFNDKILHKKDNKSSGDFGLPTDESPCFIVISNIDVNSSNNKLEKVRDLIDKFSDIPRIVITAPEDPLTFFATKLHYMVTAGLYLGPGQRSVVEI